MKEIYLDNAAATAIDPAVVRAMRSAWAEAGNPSSFNDAGRRARQALEKARVQVARFLNARPHEIVFCASGSEANTLAVMGVAALQKQAEHMITSPIEHLSVLEPMRRLAKSGWHISCTSVNGEGVMNAEDIQNLLRKNTRLVSVMYANNEIGSIQPIKKVAAIIRQWRKEHRTPFPYFHVDACQAAAWLPVDVQALGVDLLTLNGAKVHGPHGSAVLFVRRGVELVGQVLGGNQEHGLRAGTEDIAGAVGLAAALQRVKVADAKRVNVLRDRLVDGICAGVPDVRLNGPTGQGRLANNVHISIPGVDSENLLLELDRHGIRAGAGSACTAHAVEPSHVLKAIGTPKKYLDGVLRLSLSRYTTKYDIDKVLIVFPEVVKKVRARQIK